MKKIVIELHEVDGGYQGYVREELGGFRKNLFSVFGRDEHHVFQSVANRWAYLDKDVPLKYLQGSLEQKD